MAKNLRLKSAKVLANKVFDIVDFKGKWKKFIGIPESSGIWIFWGESGNGKTSFCLQLAKYFCSFFSVWYVSLEEGERRTFQIAVERSNLINHNNFKYSDIDGVDIDQVLDNIKEVLRKKRSPKVVFIDSIQFLNLTKRQYQSLKKEFGKKKILIFISHCRGRLPEGRVPQFVRYDSDVKGYIRGYKVFALSRYGGGEDYVIWEKGAYEYWNEILNEV